MRQETCLSLYNDKSGKAIKEFLSASSSISSFAASFGVEYVMYSKFKRVYFIQIELGYEIKNIKILK